MRKRRKKEGELGGRKENVENEVYVRKRRKKKGELGAEKKARQLERDLRENKIKTQWS